MSAPGLVQQWIIRRGERGEERERERAEAGETHEEEEELCKALKENSPTSSTRPKPPTPRVSMMLKSDSFRLAKKAASASYLDFLM